MYVFLGWSRETSREIAGVLRDWLPKVIQSVDAFVSTDDIDLGAAWNRTLADALQRAHFGILCVTAENLTAPWLIFEAGALSISTVKGGDAPHVTPVLFDVDRAKVPSPISQFQSVAFGERGMWHMMLALNKVCLANGERSLSDSDLKQIFDVWYPHLEQQIRELLDAAPRNTEKAADAAPSVPRTVSAPPVQPSAPQTVSAPSAFTPPPVSPANGTQIPPETAGPTAPGGFLSTLETLRTLFGFIPAIERIYVEGVQLALSSYSGADTAEKREARAGYEALVKQEIAHIESDADHSNPQRAERLRLLKELLDALDRQGFR